MGSAMKTYVIAEVKMDEKARPIIKKVYLEDGEVKMRLRWHKLFHKHCKSREVFDKIPVGFACNDGTFILTTANIAKTK